MKRFAIAALGLALALGMTTTTLAGGEGCDGCPEGAKAEKAGCDEKAKAGCEGEKAKAGCDADKAGCCDETAKAGDQAKEDCGGCAGAADTKALMPIKNLAGEWETADADKDGQPDVRVSYRVISNGTAVVETIMAGTPHEMITVFHCDAEGKLMLTHYCASGSQPRMRLAKSEGSTLKFEYVDGTNCDPAKGFMGQLTMTMAGTDQLKNEWAILKDGKVAKTMTFEFTRGGKKSTK